MILRSRARESSAARTVSSWPPGPRKGSGGLSRTGAKGRRIRKTRRIRKIRKIRKIGIRKIRLDIISGEESWAGDFQDISMKVAPVGIHGDDSGEVFDQ